MNADEARVFVVLLGEMDPRHKTASADDLVVKTAAWHDILADIPFADAREAVKSHYSQSDRLLLPVGVVDYTRTLKALRDASRPLCGQCDSGWIEEAPNSFRKCSCRSSLTA